MKVFQLNTYCGVGSTGRIALELAQAVERDGGECRIGYGSAQPTKDGEAYAYRIGNNMERKLHGAARKLFDAEGYGSLIATRNLIQAMRDFQPDVIHMHNLHGAYLNLRLLASYLRTAGVPVLWTLHDCWAFTGHCAYFDYSGCERWRTYCDACPQKASYPTCKGVSNAKRNFERKRAFFTSIPTLQIVTPCNWLRELLKDSFLCNVPSRTIYNGVDTNVFHPTEGCDYHDERKLVLAVASEWEERKGLPYLVELSKNLGDAYRVAVIGLSEEQLRTLPDSMLGLRKTASVKELAQWYTAADCLVNPTMEDNMPLVNLEALACGTPVVVYRTGGCPECVDDSCGAVVEKGDVSGLTRQTIAICDRSRDMRDACLQKARQFSGKACVDAYLRLYREVSK